MKKDRCDGYFQHHLHLHCAAWHHTHAWWISLTVVPDIVRRSQVQTYGALESSKSRILRLTRWHSIRWWKRHWYPCSRFLTKRQRQTQLGKGSGTSEGYYWTSTLCLLNHDKTWWWSWRILAGKCMLQRALNWLSASASQVSLELPSCWVIFIPIALFSISDI